MERQSVERQSVERESVEDAARSDAARSHAPRAAFHYRDKGTLATIGRSAAVALFGRIKLHGFVAWLAWLIVHLIFLIGFRNKAAVLLSWTYSYFTYKLGARIITGWPEAAAPPKPMPAPKTEATPGPRAPRTLIEH